MNKDEHAGMDGPEAQPTRDAVAKMAKMAYAIDVEEGRQQGKAKENWSEAEAQLRHAGAGQPEHPDHHALMAANFRNRFWISLLLTVPILVLSPLPSVSPTTHDGHDTLDGEGKFVDVGTAPQDVRSVAQYPEADRCGAHQRAARQVVAQWIWHVGQLRHTTGGRKGGASKPRCIHATCNSHAIALSYL